jgi:hypothetical protein
MSLTARDVAAVIGLKPNSFERWEYVSLQLADYSIGTSTLRGLAWQEEGEAPCIAAVLLGSVWHEPSGIFRESVVTCWENEARAQFAQDAADEDLQMRIAEVA